MRRIGSTTSGFPVRCQPHHLEFVAVAKETEKLRDSGVQHAEQVRKEHVIQHSNPAAFADADRGTDEVTKPVERAYRCIVERRDEEAAGEVRRMMLHVVHARQPVFWHAKRLGQRCIQPEHLSRAVCAVEEGTPGRAGAWNNRRSSAASVRVASC